jgi:zinc protease
MGWRSISFLVVLSHGTVTRCVISILLHPVAPFPLKDCAPPMRRLAVVTLLVVPGWGLASPPILSRTLANGLEVVVVEVPSSPLVTVEVAVRNGSMTEPPDFNGISHLYEHMFFKPNEALPDPEAFNAKVRSLGMLSNATTDTEHVNYFVTTTADHVVEAMAFLRDAAVTPRFDKEELAKERLVVAQEFDRDESDPLYHLSHAVDREVWWKYPSRKDPLGNRKTVLGATVEQLRTIQQRYYVPNNSVLVVTGGVKAEAVFSAAAELYKGWKPSAESPFLAHPLVHHPPIPKTKLVLVEQPVATVTGEFVWQGPSTVGNDVELTYAADLQTLALLQPASRFQKALVDSGVCLAVNFAWFSQRNTGPVQLQFDATPDKAVACIEAIQAELPAMAEPDYLTPEELRDAAHLLEVQRALEIEQPSELAHTLSFWWTSAGLDYYRTYLPKTRAVTPGDIARYMRSYVLGKPYVLGVMLSKGMASKGLSRAVLEKLAVTVEPQGTASRRSAR